MHQHAVPLEQFEGPFFIGANARHAEYCGPSSFDLEAAAERLLNELMVETRKIPANPIQNLLLDGMTPREKARQRQLHRSADRKIGIGYHFEPRSEERRVGKECRL